MFIFYVVLVKGAEGENRAGCADFFDNSDRCGRIFYKKKVNCLKKAFCKNEVWYNALSNL